MSANFREKRGYPSTNFGVRKIPGLSCGVDPTFSGFDTIPACDTQADRHTMMAITQASLAPRG